MFRGKLGMQKVLLTIKGNQIDGNPEDNVELVTEGRLYRGDNGYMIEFDESGLTGREGVTTKIQLEDGSVTLSRNGDDQMHMIFSKDSVYESNFSTPLGPVRISVLALQIKSELSDERGSLRLEYEMSTDVSCSLGKLDLSFKSIGEWIN
jgi:uncharacterized beta-barrel protein YwiB (DUF1934 family)